ncbi:solute carrier family 35 member F5 isoform X1 [Arctopsyche grandis]|uniref:solute carrier family 35 member F5 isoform X1 n=1 Tax=Arctopsyche grandis TaxID=121162 RepID=UPI00406D9E11
MSDASKPRSHQSHQSHPSHPSHRSTLLHTMLTKTQRLVLGLFILLLVDIIWVSSSELTKYIYHNEDYEKPFFSTYVKTSMFTLYLFGLCFWPPWRDQCNRPPAYMLVDPNADDENFFTDANTSLSDPTYVPVRTPEREVAEISGTESDESSQRSVRFNKVAEVRHMSEHCAAEALLARLSHAASVRAGEAARRHAAKLSARRQAKVALCFCLLWFVANYTYQASLVTTEAGVVTALSSTSSLFTLVLAALFPSQPGDRITLSKLIAVCITIGGLVLVSLSDMSVDAKRLPIGVILSLVSAFFYAAYLVFLRRKVDHEDKMDIPLFFGFVGLFNLLLLWPLFFVFHLTSWEVFEWPSKQQWLWLLLNGLVGTVLSEVLWLWGCFLTSSLIATISISLTIPMSMLADVILKKVAYPALLYAGTLPMFIAFFGVTLLAHYENWDPALVLVKKIYYYFSHMSARSRSLRINELDEQTEALIGINSCAEDHEA